MQLHPITQQSFAIIDAEIGEHRFTPAEYAVVRRVIHSSADFEFKTLMQFSVNAIANSMSYLQNGQPIVTDVGMVAQGIRTMAQQTFQNPIINALDCVDSILPGATRTESGILNAFVQYPQAIYVIGNAPTALLALCRQVQTQLSQRPCLIVGAPVGFVSVTQSKAMLRQTDVEQIRVAGRKGGSAVGAAIINALLSLAWEQQELG